MHDLETIKKLNDKAVEEGEETIVHNRKIKHEVSNEKKVIRDIMEKCRE